MPVAPDTRRWSDQQLYNARVIINVGRQLGASQRDILIALMTAFQESGLRNLSYGTGTSVGLFQQTAPWAPRSVRMDPLQSARMFFTGGRGAGQPGLLDNRNRNGMSLTQAAQWVQRSAYPNAYAKWQGNATDLLKYLGVKGTPELVPMSPEPVDRPGELDTMPGHNPVTGMPLKPIGVEAPGIEKPIAAGVESPTMAGAEAGNEMPMLGMSMDDAEAFDNSTASRDGGGIYLPSYSSYTGARGNYSLPGVKPWVLEAADEIGGKFGIKSIGGVGSRPNPSDHPGGLALDFMTQGSIGSALARYVMENAKRLGVKYIIWQQHIWSLARASEGWRLMGDRGSPTANHMDHVHVSFNSR